mmetsp:Transcript_23736/g.36661  ORF Transcript_23736/g.36661 Transcript_23736/m.36661 type:complete len:1384 (+) Transcript_23736:91-4242(+)|eukprot:CAMPEP_0195302376 /NCGR_PEP_ID=MMETSP0707-20130614/30957_1 /TAXON_ID=33640 /ORGANISM="Asterionellopsis glacialis, Strain CCMP134" /LENGTH=1383 /DNA_ID=CAMNT_0040365611 /DNA_START=54 /DNA_END=4205 /DNA_ORIENTATION=-
MPGTVVGTIAEREAELAALQSAFDEYITSSRELEEELDAELSKMQEKLSESSLANAALSSQLENIAPQLQSLEKALEDIKTKYDEEAKLRREAEMAHEDAEARFREAQGTLQNLKDDCDAAHEELAFKEEELEEARLELEVEKERSRVDMDSLKADFSKKKVTGDSAPALQEEGAAAKALQDEEKEEVVDADYVMRLEDELEIVTEQLIETETRLSETEELLAEANEEGARLAGHGSISDMLSVATFSTLEGTSEEKKKETIELHAAQLQEELIMLKNAEKTLKEELELAKEELTLTQEELAAAEEDAQRASVSLETAQTFLRQEVSKVKEQLSASQADFKTATAEVETLESALEASTTENTYLQDQIANLNKALNNAKADHSAVMEELDAVNERFDAVREEAENEGRDAAAAAIKTELEAKHKEQLNELKQDLEKLQKENEKLQQQLDDVEVQVASNRDAQATSESNEKVQSEIVTKLQSQLARTKESIASKDASIQELKTALETRVGKAENDVTRLEKELSSTKGKLAEAEAHLIVSRRDKERVLAKMPTKATVVKPIESDGEGRDDLSLSKFGESHALSRRIREASRRRARSSSPTREERLEVEVDVGENKVKDLEKANAELKDQNRMGQVRVKRLEEDLKSLQTQLFGSTAVAPTQMSRISSISGPKAAPQEGIEELGTNHMEELIKTKDIDKISTHLRTQEKKLTSQREYNSQLLSKILSLQGNIQVCCRIRPMSVAEIQGGEKGVIESLSETEVGCKDSRANKWKSFAFDKVWGPDQSQANVFQDVEPLALSVVDGYNACIFAYGQTGSGKTYTMEGTHSGLNEYGISYRTIQKIFNLLNLRVQQQKAAARIMEEKNEGMPEDSREDEDSAGAPFEFSLQVGMLEIYNDEVYDLLSELSGGNTVADKKRQAKESGSKATLDIRRSADGLIEVPNLTKESIASVEDMMKLLKRGNSNRATAATDLNEHSSRSHMVLTVDVDSGIAGQPGNKGTLFLVDLAGSERVRRSKVEGEHLKEAGHINKSLAALGNVMEALDRKAPHVPYRDSKLTYLLQDALGGNSRTMMVVACCPMETAYDETIHALQFATRVRRIQIGAAQRNTTSRNLEETVKNLTSEMKMLTKAKEKSETQLHSLKRDNTRIQERLQHISEARKTSQAENRTLEVLRKNNTEMANRWQKEKSMREKTNGELEKTQAELKKMQMSIAKSKREVDNLKMKVNEKETALERATKELRKAKEASSAANIRLRTSQIIGSRGTGRAPAPKPTPKPAAKPVKKPADAPASNGAGTKKGNDTEEKDGAAIREEVLALLQKYDTTKVGRIDVIMKRFKGKENLLLQKMKQRYEGSTDAGEEPTSLKERNAMALERHKARMQAKNEKQ